MPTLTLIARGRCAHCGCRLRGFSIGCYRINKHSLRSTDSGTLSWFECPECGPSWARRHPTGIQPTGNRFVLDEASQAVVDAHRERKGWS